MYKTNTKIQWYFGELIIVMHAPAASMYYFTAIAMLFQISTRKLVLLHSLFCYN